MDNVFPYDTQGLSAEYWCEKYEIAMWAIGESDRLHKEEVAKLKSPSKKMKRAKKFLGELLNETLSWSNTDTQHDLASEFKELLGEYCPDWIEHDKE